MTLLITAVGLVEACTDIVNDTKKISDDALDQRINICLKDACSWDLPVVESFAQQQDGLTLKVLQTALQKGLVEVKKDLELSGGDSSEAKNGWLAVIDVRTSVLPTELIEHISLNVYVHQITDDKKVICLHDRYHNYPLLSLVHFELIDEIDYYLNNGHTDFMSFIEPYMLAVAMPYHWIEHHKCDETL